VGPRISGLWVLLPIGTFIELVTFHAAIRSIGLKV
jgi:hypothetical protein